MKELAQELEPPVTEEEIQAETPVESAEPAKEPEVKEEPKKDPTERNVPHGAFHEEREKRKAAERRAAEYERNQAVLADRLNQLYSAMQQPQQPQFRDPKADPDPVDALTHNQQLLYQQQQEARQRAEWEAQQYNQRAQAAAMRQQLVDWGQVQAEEFRKEAPDFDDAYQHIRQVRAAELHALGYQGRSLAAALEQDEMNVIAAAAQQGRSPAEIVYAMAKAAGYARKEPKQEGKEKIETLQKGTQAAKTLGNGAAGGMPTPEQIAEMSEEEFEKFKRELKGKGKNLSDVL